MITNNACKALVTVCVSNVTIIVNARWAFSSVLENLAIIQSMIASFYTMPGIIIARNKEK